MTKSIKELVPIILTKTEERKIPWKSETPTLFVADIGDDLSISIQFDILRYNLALRKSTGVRLDEVSSQFMSADNDLSAEIETIYGLARRQALKIDGALDDVERNLLRM